MKKMKKIILISILLITNELFAINIKEKITRTAATALPFSKTKTIFCSQPNWAFNDEQTINLPMFLYQDINLTQQFTDPNATCIICRKFQANTDFDVVALDISVSEWAKQLLATFKDGKLIDYIEADVSWYSNGFLYIKQWRIDSEQTITVTWLKIETTTPVSAFSDFSTISAQRIDFYYKIDTNGKFQLTKEVKYKPQSYTRTYLADKTKNLWEGNEMPLK